MSQLIQVPVTSINKLPVDRNERLDLNKIKVIYASGEDVTKVVIKYFDETRAKLFEYETTKTLEQMKTLADATGYPHGLVFVFIKKIDYLDVNKYGYLNEFSVEQRLEVPVEGTTRVWYDFGDENHLDVKEIDLYYVQEYYFNEEGELIFPADVPDGTAGPDVTASITTANLCWESGASQNINVLVDRDGFTGTLFFQIKTNANIAIGATATVANPGSTATLLITWTSGNFYPHPGEQLQVIIRDGTALGDILYSFRKTLTECPA